MNAIMCELCGSNDVVKQGEYFVCQHCGTKYSLEDARKLIGTVKIDNTDNVKQYLQHARRAKEKEDWEETEQYYSLVEQNAPDNIEAIFYSSYAKARASLTSEDIYKRQAAFKILQKSLQVIDDYINSQFTPKDEPKLRSLIIQISDDILKLCGSSFVYTQTTHRYFNGSTTEYSHSDNTGETYELFEYLNFNFASTLSNISEKMENEKSPELDYLFERTIMHLQYIINQKNDWSEFSMVSAGFIDETHKKWNQYNPAHSIPPSLVAQKESDRQEYERQKERRGAEKEEELKAGCAKEAFIVIAIFIAFIIWLFSNA